MGEKRPYVDASKCTACGECVEVCFAEPPVFTLAETSQVTGAERCLGCSACVYQCPTGAVEVR